MLLAHVGQLLKQERKGMVRKFEREFCERFAVSNVRDLLSCAFVRSFSVGPDNIMDTVEAALKLSDQRGTIMRQPVLGVCEYHPTEDVHDGL